LATKLKEEPSLTNSDYQKLLLDRWEPEQPKDKTFREYKRSLEVHCGLFFVRDNPVISKDVMGVIAKHLKFDYQRFVRLTGAAYQRLVRKIRYLEDRSNKTRTKLWIDYNRYTSPSAHKIFLGYLKEVGEKYRVQIDQAKEKYRLDLGSAYPEALREVQLLAKELNEPSIPIAWAIAQNYPLFNHPYIKPNAGCIVTLMWKDSGDLMAAKEKLSQLAPYREIIYQTGKSYVFLKSDHKLIELILDHPLNDMPAEHLFDLGNNLLNTYLLILEIAQQLPEPARTTYQHSALLVTPSLVSPDCALSFEYFLLYNVDRLSYIHL